MADNGLTGTLPLPNTQKVHSNYIEWVWDGVINVNGYFSTPESCYYITINGITINPEQAKILGEILLSASRWRDTWQIHAGLYLANDGKLQASPDKGHPDDEPDNTFQC